MGVSQTRHKCSSISLDHLDAGVDAQSFDSRDRSDIAYMLSCRWYISMIL